MAYPAFYAALVMPLALATGCSEKTQTIPESGTYAENCNLPPAPFKTPADGVPVFRITLEIKLSKTGDLHFLGEPVNRQSILKKIDEWDDFDPAPYLVLAIDDDVPCTLVQAIRADLAKSPLCQGGLCAEGSDSGSWKTGRDTF